MKVNSIDVRNFKGISNMTHEFTNPVTVISGPIGVGKNILSTGTKICSYK